MSTAKLTRTMQEALDHAKKHGGKLVRYPGGFWAREGWTYYAHPWFGTTTIEGLVKRGIAEYTAWQPRGKGQGEFPIDVTIKQ